MKQMYPLSVSKIRLVLIERSESEKIFGNGKQIKLIFNIQLVWDHDINVELLIHLIVILMNL